MSFTGNQETPVPVNAIQPSLIHPPLPVVSTIPVVSVVNSPVVDNANISPIGSPSPVISPAQTEASPAVNIPTVDNAKAFPIQPNVPIYVATTSTNFTTPTQQNKPRNPPVVIPTNLPVLTKQPTGEGIEIKPANQVTNIDPSKTIEFYLSVVAEQSMVDGTSMEVYHTETFALIRPMYDMSAGNLVESNIMLYFILLFVLRLL